MKDDGHVAAGDLAAIGVASGHLRPVAQLAGKNPRDGREGQALDRIIGIDDHRQAVEREHVLTAAAEQIDALCRGDLIDFLRQRAARCHADHGRFADQRRDGGTGAFGLQVNPRHRRRTRSDDINVQTLGRRCVVQRLGAKTLVRKRIDQHRHQPLTDRIRSVDAKRWWHRGGCRRRSSLRRILIHIGRRARLTDARDLIRANIERRAFGIKIKFEAPLLRFDPHSANGHPGAQADIDAAGRGATLCTHIVRGRGYKQRQHSTRNETRQARGPHRTIHRTINESTIAMPNYACMTPSY